MKTHSMSDIRPAGLLYRVSFLTLCLLCLMAILLPGFAQAQSSGENGLTVSFLDVGEGDSILVSCDGHHMLVDGGDSSYSSYLYSILKSRGITRLDYIVATHPDADHVGGLSGALQIADAGIAFCTVEQDSTETFTDFIKYLGNKNLLPIIVPEAGDIYSLGDASVTVLFPARGISYSDNTSLVLKICYGKTSFLLTGDCGEEEEDALVLSGADVSADVLKVGHHGASGSTTGAFLSKVNPSYAVISVGENPYGHPADDTLYRLGQSGVKVYRTDLQGIITCTSDGNLITFQTERNDIPVSRKSATNTESAASSPSPSPSPSAPSPTPSPIPQKSVAHTTDYIVNINTGKFHYPDCKSVNRMKESNKWYYTGSRDDLISQGYSPCGNCHP